MKRVSLIVMGLSVLYIGLQSFVQDNTDKSEKTTLTVSAENWSNDDVEGTEQALNWRIKPCTTNDGISGTSCVFWVSTNPLCKAPEGPPPCNPNS